MLIKNIRKYKAYDGEQSISGSNNKQAFLEQK